MMDMAQIPDLKLINIFIIIVKNQGFANAQHELNLSTSAISTYMSQLESTLGMTLCQRGRAGFSLTPKGEMFYHEACQILEEFEKFKHHTAQIKGQLNGTLKIGIIDSIVTEPHFPLDQIIGHFTEQHPHIYLRLQVQSPYELQMSILENRIDVAIGSFFVKMQGITYHPLYQEQHWLYCSNQHPLYNNRNLTAPCITHEKMVNRGYWSQNELAKHGFKYSAATVESMEAQLILILSGKYIGYLPEHYAQHWVDQQRFKILLPAVFGYQAPFSMISRRGKSKELLIQNFRELVIKHIKKTFKSCPV